MILKKKEHIVVLSILIIISTFITYVQYHKWIHNSSVRADTGFLLEMTDNIANGNGDKSSIYAAMYHFSKERIPYKNAKELCQKKLGTVTEEYRNVLESHKYYITYVVAIFAKFFDVKILYYILHVFGFFTMLYILYRILRENNISILLASLFTILIFVHPAFSLSLLGQLYAERFFIPFAMIFLYFVQKKDVNLEGLYISAFFIALVSERAPLMMGIFIFGYTILLWENIEKRKKIHLGVIGSLFLSFALYSLVSIANSMRDSISTYLPNSIHELISRFTDPIFLDHLLIFGIFSFLFLGIFSIFRWKLFLLALMMMIPNIIGDIGGAEKTGYFSHYHSLYFPFLVFASVLGYIKMVEIFKDKKYFFIIPILMIGLILLSSASSPNAKDISTKNILQENPILRDVNLYPDIFDETSYLRQYLKDFKKINETIPDGSIVTSGEIGQVLVWKNKINYFYPMGLDIADYAILYVTKTDNGYEYSGAATYLGAEETKKIDECMIRRMLKQGYDFEHQIVINNYAIIKRIK